MRFIGFLATILVLTGLSWLLVGASFAIWFPEGPGRTPWAPTNGRDRCSMSARERTSGGSPFALARFLKSPSSRFAHLKRFATMKIKLSSVLVDDQDKALEFYTQVLGFVKKKDIP